MPFADLVAAKTGKKAKAKSHITGLHRKKPDLEVAIMPST